YSGSGGGRFVTITDTSLWASVWDFDCDGDLNFYDSDNEILAVNTINWLAESLIVNNPPSIEGVELNTSMIYRGEGLGIKVFATDPEDGLDITVSGSIFDPSDNLVTTLDDWVLIDDYFEASWSPSYGDPVGEYAIHILVTDNDGETTVAVSGFQVDNNLPYITSVSADPAQIYRGQSLEIHVYAGDLEDGPNILIRVDIYGPDGSQIDTLYLDYQSFNGEYFVTTWSSSNDASTGFYNISIKVNDLDGGTVSKTYSNVFSIEPPPKPQSVPTGEEGGISVLLALGVASIIGIVVGAAIFYSKKIRQSSYTKDYII
ncbi:MAG: hypothetical protein ACFE68_06130, partial [Candidatus Hodarchaeota archaeon]